jgi:beta-glucosidase
MNLQYLDAVLLGRYPEALEEIFGEAWPAWPPEDLKSISQPIDFVGINYYTRNVTRFDAAKWPLRAAPVRQKQSTYTETGWEVFPQGLVDTLVAVKERYGNPRVYVTENGAPFDSPLQRMPSRRSVARRLPALTRPRRSRGARGRRERAGYFAWSLFDNFEWSLLPRLRHRARQFRKSAAHAEGQRAPLRQDVATRGRVLMASPSLAPP